MAESERMLFELKKVLAAYAANAKPESMVALRDLLSRMEQTGALDELGCNRDCPHCTWGDPEAEPWKNHCRLWAFQELVEDSDVGRARGNAVVQREAKALLAFVEGSPTPAFARRA